MTALPLRLGVAGLGRAFMLMAPTLLHPSVRVAAAADPRSAARDRFASDFGAPAYATVEELCADPAVDAVYVATPHQFHLEHVRTAAAHGKHVLVEKPMALAIEDCLQMVEAAEQAGVHLLVGHSHSYDLPYLRTRALIESGEFGAVRMVTALNFTDYIYRPRRPEELDTGQGGGAIFAQAPHQVEVARLLVGSPASAVRASAGAWDAARPTEGAYSAHLTFDDGAFAALTYSGYGHFDTDAFQGWIGEMGQQRDGSGHGGARRRIQGLDPVQEAELKNARAYGAGALPAGAAQGPPPLGCNHSGYNHFGLVIVSCERGDLRPTPHGVEVHGDFERRFEPLPPPSIPRAEVVDELVAAVTGERPPLHTGRWGLATTEICLAILQSSRTGKDMALHHQAGVPAPRENQA